MYVVDILGNYGISSFVCLEQVYARNFLSGRNFFVVLIINVVLGFQC